jgi:hypothetical protein
MMANLYDKVRTRFGRMVFMNIKIDFMEEFALINQDLI